MVMANVTMPEQTTRWPRDPGRVLRILVIAVLAATTTLAGTEPAARADTTAATPAEVSVDFGSEQGRLAHPETYNNFGNVTAWPAQRRQDVAFLNQQGLH